MKVNIPKEFSIGVTKAFVQYDKNLFVDDGYNGTFNRRTGELKLDARLYGIIRDKTFGHELMEVIKDNYNLHTAEDDMSNIANGWLEFLKQLGVEFSWEDIKKDVK